MFAVFQANFGTWSNLEKELSMHTYTLEQWQHTHRFLMDHDQGVRRTRYVMMITGITMILEIVAGAAFGSMALLADGWHMGTHVAAFGITLFAYFYARRHVDSPQYTFGTGKVSVLGGFASAVALAVVALVMAIESIQRIYSPSPIQFTEATAVACLGLLVNVICALLLQERHMHEHEDGIRHHDHNLRAAYLHVLADALTSVLAIVALSLGKSFDWTFLDPVMGLVGAGIITRWAYGLVRETSFLLLDARVDEHILAQVKSALERDADNRVSDLHVWQVGSGHLAAIISLVTHYPQPASHYKELLRDIAHLSHVTVEVNRCAGESCVVSNSSASRHGAGK